MSSVPRPGRCPPRPGRGTPEGQCPHPPASAVGFPRVTSTAPPQGLSGRFPGLDAPLLAHSAAGLLHAIPAVLSMSQN
nr:MAG TPA: hypothetical protein [Caudoviricetes sp.]